MGSHLDSHRLRAIFQHILLYSIYPPLHVSSATCLLRYFAPPLLHVLVLGEQIQHTGRGGHGVDFLQLSPPGRDLTEMVAIP